MRSTGDTENVDRNQRVLARLASGLFRNESRSKKRVPDRGRLFMTTHELKRLQLTNAKIAIGDLADDTSLGGMIIKSNAHDSAHHSRDMDFRTLGFLLSSTLSDLSDGCVRIFDIARCTNG